MGSKIRPEKSKGELSRPGKLQGGVKCALPENAHRQFGAPAPAPAQPDAPPIWTSPAPRAPRPAALIRHSSAGRKRAPSFCTSGTNRFCLFFRLDIVVQIDYNVHSKTNRNKPIYTIYCILKIEQSAIWKRPEKRARTHSERAKAAPDEF